MTYFGLKIIIPLFTRPVNIDALQLFLVIIKLFFLCISVIHTQFGHVLKQCFPKPFIHGPNDHLNLIFPDSLISVNFNVFYTLYFSILMQQGEFDFYVLDRTKSFCAWGKLLNSPTPNPPPKKKFLNFCINFIHCTCC
jgi:hypothetical protein